MRFSFARANLEIVSIRASSVMLQRTSYKLTKYIYYLYRLLFYRYKDFCSDKCQLYSNGKSTFYIIRNIMDDDRWKKISLVGGILAYSSRRISVTCVVNKKRWRRATNDVKFHSVNERKDCGNNRLNISSISTLKKIYNRPKYLPESSGNSSFVKRQRRFVWPRDKGTLLLREFQILGNK